MAVDLQLFSAGHCASRAWLVESGPFSRHVHLPALVARITHETAGTILFDTGYGRPLVESRSWAARLYRRLLPFSLEGAEFPFDGVDVVFLSHFHPDHIGSLRELSGVPILHSAAGLAELRGYSPWQRFRAAFFPELMPDDFDARALAIEDLPRVALDASWLPLTDAYDVTGDGSVLAISLPGHAVGQYGLLCRTKQRGWTFLVADAAWTRRNITALAMPGWPANRLTGDARTLRTTLEMLHEFHKRHPEVLLVPSHCQDSMEAFRHDQ